MNDYTSTHLWNNGCVVTVEKKDNEIELRIQDDKENMLCDIVAGEYEALCIAHSILSVMTKSGNGEV